MAVFKVVTIICATAGAVTAAPAAPKPAPSRQIEDGVLTYLMRWRWGRDPSPAPSSAAAVRDDAILMFDGGGAAGLFSIDLKSVGKIAVVVDADRHAAWFQGVATALTYDQTGDGCAHSNTTCPPPSKLDLHIAGLALDDRGWKLAVVIVSTTEPNQILIERAERAQRVEGWKIEIPSQPDTEGDAGLVQAATSWLVAGKLATSAARGTVFAAGSTISEFASGGAATKLAGTWDKLKLAPLKLTARTFGDGTIGFVTIDTAWPFRRSMSEGEARGGRGSSRVTLMIPLQLAIVAVRERDTWKWVELNFGG